MAATDLAIRIATTMDATGINKAGKAVNKLEKSTKSLGRSLGIALSTTAIVAYGKASVRAFANAEAQQQRLVQLLKVGVGATDSQIESLNKQADALERVGVVSAGNVTQVQSQLATFNLQASTIAALTPAILDYVTAEKGAAASTEEFRSATNGLAQALNGNFTSLTRVGFVIDQNTRDLIKNGTEAERTAAIVQVLDSTYKGFNASLRDTSAGGLQVLANAADAAREAIGESLVDAFARLGGGSEIGDAIKTIEQVTSVVQTLITVVSTAVGGLVSLYKGLDFITSFGGRTGGSGTIAQYGESVKERIRQFENPRSASPAGTALRMRKEREQQALAAKRAKELAALNKKQLDITKKLTAEQKKQAALKKAGTVFDLDQIQVIAALKGQVSDEDRKRLELQFALLVGNEKEASRLTLEIARAQGLGENLARFLASLPAAKNPFAAWEDYLDMLMEKARKLGTVTSSSTAASATASSQAAAAAAVIASPAFVGTPFGQAGSAAATALGTPFGQAGSATPSTNVVPFVGTPFGQAGGNGSGFVGTPFGQSIELKITGEGDITNAIAKGLQNQSLSTGTTTTINRSGGFL